MYLKGRMLITVFLLTIALTFIGGLLNSKSLQTLIVNHMNKYNSLDGLYSKLNDNVLSSFNKLLDLSLFKSKRSMLEIKINWINKPKWFPLDPVNLYLNNQCVYNNCKLLAVKNTIKGMKALIFSGQNKLGNKSIIYRHGRPSDQVWVFFRMEPPARRYTYWYNHSEWHNTMNWTWGYRRDSDIYFPYQTLKRKHDNRNIYDYRKVFRLKTKSVAWVVSHCRTQSQRHKYVQGLQKAGLSVDIFGKCSTSEQYKPREFINRILNNTYKFVLAFENSLCKDYITEKFFSKFDLDIIPIVRGSFNYSEHFERLTYIDITDFLSIQEAANYIQSVGSNESLYSQYLESKNKFTKTPMRYEMSKSACTLCKMLNNQNKYQKVYKNIESYTHYNTCYPPNDIK